MTTPTTKVVTHDRTVATRPRDASRTRRSASAPNRNSEKSAITTPNWNTAHTTNDNGVVLRDRYVRLSSGKPDQCSCNDAVRHVKQICKSGDSRKCTCQAGNYPCRNARSTRPANWFHTAKVRYTRKNGSITGENRWDEKAGLRRDAVRSQVIDAL